MNIDLHGKTALITGGNTGLGRAISLALAAAGASEMALTYFSSEPAETLAELRALGCEAIAYRLDATDSSQVNAVVAQAAQALGGHIDILVNNSGGLGGRVRVDEMDDAFWHNVMDVNVSSAFYCTRAVLPYMDRGWGRIVNQSSLAGRNGGGRGTVAYAAAKAALIGMTRALAKELAPGGITVNAVAAGMILGTAFHETFTPLADQEATIVGVPLHRAGVPDDVAGAVLYLVSDLAAYQTGLTIDVNGGAYFS